jgi:hypothetical protein
VMSTAEGALTIAASAIGIHISKKTVPQFVKKNR